MRFSLLVPTLGLALALGACATESYPLASPPQSATAERAAAPRPAPGEALAPPDALARADSSAVPPQGNQAWVSKYPYGTTDSAATGRAAAAAPEPANPEPEIRADSTGWVKADGSDEEHQADIESCYRYAFSQVDHDFLIDGDVAAARPGDSDNGLGFTSLNQRLNLYDQRNRRTELINRCMQGKGYTRI